MIVSGVWHVYQFVLLRHIKVDQSNLEAHEKAAGTFVKMEAGSENPHAHD